MTYSVIAPKSGDGHVGLEHTMSVREVYDLVHDDDHRLTLREAFAIAKAHCGAVILHRRHGVQLYWPSSG